MSSHKTASRLMGAALGSALAVFVMASMTANAGEGNGNYLGILSSTSPTGYTPSPASYSVGQVLIFQFDVTNLTPEQQSMSLQLNLEHITVYQGQNVSDGQPGVTNGAVVDGQFTGPLSTEIQDPNPTFTSLSIAASNVASGARVTQTLHMSRSLTECGYFQVDVAKSGLSLQKGLAGFEIRVLGCSPTPVTSPSPSSSPGGGGVSGGGSTPTPTPFGAVLAATGSTPPAELVALPLLGFGAIALITGFAWSRRRRES